MTEHSAIDQNGFLGTLKGLGVGRSVHCTRTPTTARPDSWRPQGTCRWLRRPATTRLRDPGLWKPQVAFAGLLPVSTVSAGGVTACSPINLGIVAASRKTFTLYSCVDTLLKGAGGPNSRRLRPITNQQTWESDLSVRG